jgi:CBS domain-containing protein
MKARDLMTPAPVTVTPETTIAAAAARMDEHGVSLLPVVDAAGHAALLGILSDRDIVERCAALQHRPGCVVRDHMTTSALQTVRPDDDVEIVVAKVSAKRIHRVPVVDEGRGVVGIISRADIVQRLTAGDSPLRQRVIDRIASPSRGE